MNICSKLWSFPAGNSCYLKCAQSPEEFFKTTEGIFVSLLLKGVHFLENLRLADLREPITGCLNLWKSPISEQPFLSYLQKFSRLLSLWWCSYSLATGLPLPMLGKRIFSAPGSGSIIMNFHKVVKHRVPHSSVVFLLTFLNSCSYAPCEQSNIRQLTVDGCNNRKCHTSCFFAHSLAV